jgi:hypothetical protein
MPDREQNRRGSLAPARSRRPGRLRLRDKTWRGEPLLAVGDRARRTLPLVNDDPNAIRDSLRGASDGLLVAIREVDVREQKKRGIPPGDPGFAPLAREVRIAAEAVLALAREEETRANQASQSRAGARLPTINASTPPADLARILEQWRAVERRLAAAEPGSPDAERLLEEFQALRDQYARALKALRDKG